MLTAIYLQPAALPLIDGSIVNALASDARVRAAAPIAFGDVVRGYPWWAPQPHLPRVGAASSHPRAGCFAGEGEAVIGAGVRLRMGETVVPSHALVGHGAPFGVEGKDEAMHRHAGVRYAVVGRLPRLGSAWDNAILVPIESVWETHGLGNGHARRVQR